MFLKLSGPLITLAGVVLGLWGTLLMCRVFHPLGDSVIGEIFVVLWLFTTGRRKQASQSLRNAGDFAKINEDRVARTLAGVYVLVFSFFVQMVGAVLIVVDLLVSKG